MKSYLLEILYCCVIMDWRWGVMGFIYNVDKRFFTGITRIERLFESDVKRDIVVSACRCDKIGVLLSGNNATIYYNKEHIFFRELGFLFENCGSDFELFEDDHFSDISTMIDTSRGAVPKVESVKNLLTILL